MAQDIEYLLNKALNLPLSPGVYIMRDVGGKVIYVGKSRALKNRVSQYIIKIVHKRDHPCVFCGLVSVHEIL